MARAPLTLRVLLALFAVGAFTPASPGRGPRVRRATIADGADEFDAFASFGPTAGDSSARTAEEVGEISRRGRRGYEAVVKKYGEEGMREIQRRGHAAAAEAVGGAATFGRKDRCRACTEGFVPCIRNSQHPLKIPPHIQLLRRKETAT